VNEWICIGDSIRICVVDIRGDKVRLGIEAPREIPVHRSELRRRIQESAQAANPDVTVEVVDLTDDAQGGPSPAGSTGDALDNLLQQEEHQESGRRRPPAQKRSGRRKRFPV